MPSLKTIGRLSLYRSIINRMLREGTKAAFSHELAALAGNTPAQVRRDLMVLGVEGSPARGYDLKALVQSIGNFLDAPEPESVVLVGAGNLGRAIMAFFSGRRPMLTIAAAFDTDTQKTGRLVHGIQCHPTADLPGFVAQRGIRTAVITVPAAHAQAVADQLVRAGVRGILNFAPVRLRVAETVYVENMDVAMCLEKVAYVARQREGAAGPAKA